MNEYLDGLDYPLEYHLLLRVLIIFVLRSDVVYHEEHGEEQEQSVLDLCERRERLFKRRPSFPILPDGGIANIVVNSAELRTWNNGSRLRK